MKKGIITFVFLVICIFFCSFTYAEDGDITDTFADENLRAEILELAKEAVGDENKTTIYESDIDRIVEGPGGSSLRLAGKGIKDLSGIEVFSDKGITWIFLDWNEITDLTPLRGFSSLEKISFSGNNVSDISVLGGLENLENITAINNKIENIDVLGNLDMKYICLDGNNISDISVVSNWTNLVDMSFQNNRIENIPDLSALSNLETVNLSNNKIKSIENINGNMKELSIDNNELPSLSGIQNLLSLEILSCSNNQISSLAELEGLSKLENLNINKNQIRDIESLANCSLLKYLYMDNNFITNFENISNLTALEKYSAYNQTIAVEIKEKIIGENVEIPLPDLYKALYDENSFIYKEGLKTEIIGAFEYQISQENDTITLKAEDLQKGDIVVQVSDEYNTLLKYTIQLDKMPPQIEGIENGKTYSGAVIPSSSDDDVGAVELYKNGEKINYELGNTIAEEGAYRLIIRDKAGNETVIEFKIQYQSEPEEPDADTEDEELESNGEEYKLDGQYIIGVDQNTLLETFEQKLNGNVDYNVYRKEALLKNGEIVSTGDRLVTEYGVTFYIIVKGDITKDGITNIKDLIKIRRNILGLEEFDELQGMAADLAEDKIINIKDLVRIRKIILGLEI